MRFLYRQFTPALQGRARGAQLHDWDSVRASLAVLAHYNRILWEWGDFVGPSSSGSLVDE